MRNFLSQFFLLSTLFLSTALASTPSHWLNARIAIANESQRAISVHCNTMNNATFDDQSTEKDLHIQPKMDDIFLIEAHSALIDPLVRCTAIHDPQSYFIYGLEKMDDEYLEKVQFCGKFHYNSSYHGAFVYE